MGERVIRRIWQRLQQSKLSFNYEPIFRILPVWNQLLIFLPRKHSRSAARHLANKPGVKRFHNGSHCKTTIGEIGDPRKPNSSIIIHARPSCTAHNKLIKFVSRAKHVYSYARKCYSIKISSATPTPNWNSTEIKFHFINLFIL